MVRERIPPPLVTTAFVIGYAFGALGWLWDDLEHLGVLHLGFGATPAHLLLSVSTLFILATLAFGLRRFVGRLLAYGGFLAGLALSYVHPMFGTVGLLSLPVAALWFYLLRGQRMLWPGVTAVSIAIVLVGGIVDWTWHRAHPGVSEGNMLLLPGHAIQLAGWLLGLIGAGIAFVQDRAERQDQRDCLAAAGGPLLVEACGERVGVEGQRRT